MNFAALLLPFALMQAAPAPAPEAAAPRNQARFDRCVAAIDADAPRAYEDAMAWAAEGHSLDAYRCAAMALSAQNRNDEAARRFEALASTINPALTGEVASLFDQAGNAWLLARDPAHARSAFTRAIVVMQGDRTQLPDLLIDRARAYAMETDYRAAEEDLSQALDIRPNDPLALRLRAAARMHQNSFDLALADAQAAVTLAPRDIDALLMLGHATEAKRTGQPVMEQ